VNDRADIAREGSTKIAPRLNHRAQNDKRRADLLGHLRDGSADLAVPRPHDLSARAYPVALDKRTLCVKLGSKLGLFRFEMRIEWQLPLDEKRGKHEYLRAVAGEPAGELQRMRRLLRLEQWNNDRSAPPEPP
jgi:hypothetical protein